MEACHPKREQNQTLGEDNQWPQMNEGYSFQSTGNREKWTSLNILFDTEISFGIGIFTFSMSYSHS